MEDPMALSEFEVRKIEIVMGRFLEKKRPPPHLRNKVDIAYTISNQSVEIFEKREHWLDPSKSLNTPIAKATFVKRTKRWKLYWMPSDLKWLGFKFEVQLPEAC